MLHLIVMTSNGNGFIIMCRESFYRLTVNAHYRQSKIDNLL